MPPNPLKTPVAFFIFNRPEITCQVFAAIRQAKPEHLFVFADGPRLGRPGEEDLCRQARAIVGRVDWPCQVLTDFAETNLGCRRRIVSGLDRVFASVEEAIILEDDCLPAPTFFRFCEELLDHYRHEPRIGQIGGVNFQPPGSGDGCSYYFSRYNHIWGWASWRRAWNLHDDTMSGWPAFRDEGGLEQLMRSAAERRYWIETLDRIACGELDTWDCQWGLSCWRHHLLTALPAVNLVSNIGFGPAATHTTGSSRFAGMPTGTLDFPLRHPQHLVADARADAYTSRIQYRPLTLMRKLMILLGRSSG